MSARAIVMIMSAVGVALGQETCSTKTHGSCTFLACDADRGPTDCVEGEGSTFFTQKKVCVCQKGYCATADEEKCQKQVTKDDVAAAKKTAAGDVNATAAAKKSLAAATAAEDHANGVYQPLQKDADEKQQASAEADAAFKKVETFQHASGAANQKAQAAFNAAHKAQVQAGDAIKAADATLASDTAARKEGEQHLQAATNDVQEAQKQQKDAEAAGKANLGEALKAAVATAIAAQKKVEARLNELKNTEVASTQAAAQALKEWRAAQATEASKLAAQERLAKATNAADSDAHTDADKALAAKKALDEAAKKAKDAKDELDAKTKAAEAAKKAAAAAEKAAADDKAAAEAAEKTYNRTDLVAVPRASTCLVILAMVGAASMFATVAWRRASRDSSALGSRLINEEGHGEYDAL